MSQINKCINLGKHVVVTGCLPKVNPARLEGLPVSILDTNSLDKIPQAIKEKKKFYSDEHENKLLLPHHQNKTFTGIIEVNEGCLGKCAYCGTKNARGNLTSFPQEDILDYAKKLINLGKKEIFLTSQDTGCYGLDTNTDITELVAQMAETPGNYLLRVGMMNPNHALRLLPKLPDMLNNPRVYSFLHIPVQSGSNRVLKNMNRQYTVQDYKKIVRTIKQKAPQTTIATDIITGLPGETETDHHHTLRLIRETKPDVANLSKFYPRPNTRAEKMPRIKTQVIKKRSTQLSKLINRVSTSQNKHLMGKQFTCLTLSKGFGRTTNYKSVFLDTTQTGAMVNAKITGYGAHHLKAKVL